MKIDFDAIPVAVTPNMKGGEKEVASRRFQDELGGILKGKLIPGASIGLHTHESNYEVIYIVSGRGTMLCDGEKETLGRRGGPGVLRRPAKPPVSMSVMENNFTRKITKKEA